MNRSLPIILTILMMAAFSSQAQITITIADVINLNDSIVTRQDQYSGIVGDSGTNKTWAFPTLLPTLGTKSVTYTVSPAATPFRSVQGSNMAFVNDSSYTFFNRVSTGANQGLYLKALAVDLGGLGAPSTGLALLSLVTPQPFIKTPLNYLNNYRGSTNTSRLAISYDTVVSVGGVNVNVDSVGILANIRVKQRVNGWGSVIVGQSQPMPALRSVYNQTVGLTIQVHTFILLFGRKVSLGWQNFPGVSFPPSESISVQYWANGAKYPVVGFTVDSLESASSVEFLPRVTTSLANSRNFNHLVSISPNPASNILTIALADGLVAQRLTLISVTGQTVISRTNDLTGSQLLDISTIARGTYMVLLDLGNGLIHRQRVIVR